MTITITAYTTLSPVALDPFVIGAALEDGVGTTGYFRGSLDDLIIADRIVGHQFKPPVID